MLLSFVFDFKRCQTHKDIHNPYSVIIALILFFRTLLEELYRYLGAKKCEKHNPENLRYFKRKL